MKGWIVLTVAAASALLIDYPVWQARRAERKLSSGDLAGALATLSTLEQLPGRAAVASFNRGVVLCRMGNYSAAGASFQRSAASGGPALRSRALYNLGTSRILVAERRPGGTAGTEGLLREAVRDLQSALALEPSDADAAANLTVAQGRLLALAHGSPTREGQQPAAQPGTGAPDRREEKPRTPRDRNHASATTGKATGQDQEGAKRRPADIDRHQALRMLNDARGREMLRSEQVSARHDSAPAASGKDW